MKKEIFCYLFMLLSFGVQGDWQLSNQDSAINFVSIKKSTVGEVHTFKKISGSINSQGKAQVLIDLSSVDTHIAIRDERIRGLLFEVAQFATASISAEVDGDKLKAMKSGDFYQTNLAIRLGLHGVDKKIETIVRVVKLSDGRVRVSSGPPMIIAAKDFGLSKGVEALRLIANLPSVSAAVPVTFDLLFTEL